MLLEVVALRDVMPIVPVEATKLVLGPFTWIALQLVWPC